MNILIVEDDEAFSKKLERTVSECLKYSFVNCAATVDDAVSQISVIPYDVISVDANIPLAAQDIVDPEKYYGNIVIQHAKNLKKAHRNYVIACSDDISHLSGYDKSFPKTNFNIIKYIECIKQFEQKNK